MRERHAGRNDGHGSRGGVSDEFEHQVLGTVQDRTVTVHELIGKKRWHECDLVRKRVAVFFPDWTMNADCFISSMWIAFQVIGRRTVRRAHVTCHVNPKPVGFISLPYLPEGFWPDRNPSGEAERELRVGLYHSLVTAGC